MEDREIMFVRVPASLKTQIETCAKINLRSTTREIEHILTNHVQSMNTTKRP
jgi:hypothetical protein